MSVLSSLEGFMERLLEHGVTRVTRSRLQPIELAKRAARAMESNKSVGVGRIIAPNRYDIWLSSPDYARLAPLQATVMTDVATYLSHYAKRHGYVLPTAPIISLQEDDGLSVRTVVVDVFIEDAPQRDAVHEDGDVQPTKLMPVLTPELVSSAAALVAGERTYRLEPGTITIGRSLENTIVLDDKRISRYHARLRFGSGHWVMSDVGSTNGTFVNDTQIKQRTLNEGDRISLGGLPMVFREDWTPAP